MPSLIFLLLFVLVGASLLFIFGEYFFFRLQPKSVWWVVSICLPKSVYGIVNGAADFVADLPQLLAEWKRPFILVPVVVPPSPAIAGVVPVPRWREGIQVGVKKDSGKRKQTESKPQHLC